MCFDVWKRQYYASGKPEISREELIMKYLDECVKDSMLRYRPQIVAKLVERIVFWDFHGTLCPLQATPGRVLIPEDEYATLFFDREDPLSHRIPSNTLMKLVNTVLDPNKQFLLSVVTSSLEFDAEKNYMREYFPVIPEANLIAVAKPEYKATFIRAIVESNRLDEIPVNYAPVMVDDSFNVISSVQNDGIATALHISSLIP